MSIQTNDRNDFIDASAGIDRLRKLLSDQGSEWICTTPAMICGEHEADCTPGTPLRQHGAIALVRSPQPPAR
jgi:hypothetical protein